MYSVGRDVVVGLVTRYGLDGPGIESCGARVSAPFTPALWYIHPPVQWLSGLLPRGKAVGACH